MGHRNRLPQMEVAEVSPRLVRVPDISTAVHSGDVGQLCADAVVLGGDRGRFVAAVNHPRIFGWKLPGGHVEPHESPRDAAVRELAEETGLVAVPHPRPVCWYRAPASDHQHLVLVYAFSVPEPLAPLEPEEGRAARWLDTAASIPSDGVLAWREVLRLARAALY